MAIAIAGGTGGIGLGIAVALVQQGYQVRLQDRGPGATRERAYATLEPLRADAILDCTSCDFRLPGEVEQLAAVWSEGPLSGLVCAVGPFLTGSWDALSPDQHQMLLQTNLLSPWQLLQLLMPRLRATGGGVITLIGQNHIQDLAAAPRWASYNAAKAGLVILTRTIAQAEGPAGIRINLVNPGIIQNGMYSEAFFAQAAQRVPLRRVGQPADLAELVCFLHSPAAGYISGAVIDCNGGLDNTAVI